MSMLVPRLWNCCWTIRPADWLTETSKITAATPITMPSTVRPARILCFAKARKATRRIIESVHGSITGAVVWRSPSADDVVCMPATTSCPSRRLPETNSVELLSLSPVTIGTAASRSPSSTQT